MGGEWVQPEELKKKLSRWRCHFAKENRQIGVLCCLGRGCYGWHSFFTTNKTVMKVECIFEKKKKLGRKKRTVVWSNIWYTGNRGNNSKGKRKERRQQEEKRSEKKQTTKKERKTIKNNPTKIKTQQKKTNQQKKE